MNGSLLVAYCCTTIFPCYMSLEINQSMQGPNGHYDKDYRVGQLPSLLGNMQIYNFPLTAQAKLIACRLLYWLTFQSRWKVESLTRNRIFERTKQQNEEFFLQNSTYFVSVVECFQKHKAWLPWQGIRSGLLLRTTLDGKLWICFSKLCQSVYCIIGIGNECDLFDSVDWLID